MHGFVARTHGGAPPHLTGCRYTDLAPRPFVIGGHHTRQLRHLTAALASLDMRGERVVIDAQAAAIEE
jgi:hypothetical protein